jgi:hypothetical protein
LDGSHDLNSRVEIGSLPEKVIPTSRIPVWFQFLLPSVSDLLFILLLASLTIGALAPRLLGDAGTGWHIRDGELILHTHSITRTDPFSATMNGQPWYAWEWLWDMTMAAIHTWAGLNGVVFVTALVMAFTFALTFHLALRRGAALPAALLLLILAVGASAIHLFARPHVFSWLLAVIWFEVLDSAEESSDLAARRRLFWLPVLMLLWVNVHGGFVLGVALCGIYLVAGFVRYWRAKDQVERQGTGTWLRRLSLVTTLSLLAGLVNPFGYKLYLHIYSYLSDRFLMNHIDEFRSPDFHGAAQQCFAVLLLIAIVALAAGGRKLRPSQTMVVLFATYSGLYASRNLPVSAILLTLILAPLLSQQMAEVARDPSAALAVHRLFTGMVAFSERMKRMQAGCRGHLWPAIAVTLGLVVCAHQGKLGSRHLMNAQFSSKRFPVAAVNFIAQRGISEPIFSDDYWGGYLIYRLYPHTRVFLDDRHDFYGDAFLTRYLKIIHVAPGWDAELKAMDPKWILLPREATLTSILKELPEWKVVYDEGNATLFQKAEAPETIGTRLIR